MKEWAAGKKALCILSTCLLLIVLVVQVSPLTGSGGGLLLTLLFWISVVEGCVAIAAVGDLTKARWTGALKKRLLSTHPLIAVLGLLFLLISFNMELYPWIHEEGKWLNRWFFLGRNFTVIMLAYLAARKYASLSEKESDERYLYGIIYLFLFVLSQSLVAFDWVMSLQYPWVSTLFGAYFFIESLYGGLAVAGILFVFFHEGKQRGAGSAEQYVLKDLATLLFGFSLLWAGFFYSQFLVIWYGNIPEEVSFLVERVSSSPIRELSWAILAHFFFIPFLLLITRRRKESPGTVFFVSYAVLSGILLERFVFLSPRLQVAPGPVVIDFFAFLLIFIYVIGRKSH